MREIRPTKQGTFPYIRGFRDFPFYDEVALGNWTQYRVALFETEEGHLFVGIAGRGCYTFSTQPHWGYVQEKLGLKFEGDARNLADFIADQFEMDRAERQGIYTEGLCK